MPKNSRQGRTGLDALRAKAAALQEELGNAAKVILELEQAREDDLQVYRSAVSEAAAGHAKAKRLQLDALRAAAATEQKGRALIASGEKLMKEAGAERDAADGMDLGLEDLRAATASLAARQEHWKAKLAERQTGAIRRQRSQLKRTLEKVLRRLKQKEAEPEPVAGAVSVMPQGRGTPKPVPASSDAPNAE